MAPWPRAELRVIDEAREALGLSEADSSTPGRRLTQD